MSFDSFYGEAGQFNELSEEQQSANNDPSYYYDDAYGSGDYYDYGGNVDYDYDRDYHYDDDFKYVTPKAHHEQPLHQSHHDSDFGWYDDWTMVPTIHHEDVLAHQPDEGGSIDIHIEPKRQPYYNLLESYVPIVADYFDKNLHYDATHYLYDPEDMSELLNQPDQFGPIEHMIEQVEESV